MYKCSAEGRGLTLSPNIHFLQFRSFQVLVSQRLTLNVSLSATSLCFSHSFLSLPTFSLIYSIFYHTTVIPSASPTCTPENTDRRDAGCTGPISWVLLTAGTHLITAETEVGGGVCQSFSLDQCGPSQLRPRGRLWLGLYLSYSIASIQVWVDNQRLVIFVSVLRDLVAIWPESWMNALMLDFSFGIKSCVKVGSERGSEMCRSGTSCVLSEPSDWTGSGN